MDFFGGFALDGFFVDYVQQGVLVHPFPLFYFWTYIIILNHAILLNILIELAEMEER